jgi:hypothetical protein
MTIQMDGHVTIYFHRPEKRHNPKRNKGEAAFQSIELGIDDSIYAQSALKSHSNRTENTLKKR